VPEIIEYGTMVQPVAQSVLSITDDVLAAVDEEAGLLTTVSGRVLAYSKVLTCTATAYTTERQAWKITATGTTARVGAIAVDPRVIPYGTVMYILSADGSITYGVATAEDCGGSIKGNKIDLFFDTYDECIRFGRRECTVYILK
jgi:3D (Asp-Asp-Asp) domain-containing protein